MGTGYWVWYTTVLKLRGAACKKEKTDNLRVFISKTRQQPSFPAYYVLCVEEEGKNIHSAGIGEGPVSELHNSMQ